MRIAINVVVLLCFITSAWAVNVGPAATPLRKPTTQIGTASSVRPVSVIKLTKFPYQPVVVKSPGSNPPPNPTSGQTGAATGAAYKTGSGVVLRPAFLTDPATGSEGSIYLLSLTPDMLTKLQNRENDIKCVMSLIDQAHSSANTSLFGGCFKSVPQGMHTYVFTCRFFGGDDLKNRLWFQVGDQQLGPDKQVVNPATNEISLVFTYQAESEFTNYVNVGAYVKPNDTPNTYWRGLTFWYMQLAQIN